ncbi:myeloid leukemia factor 1-like [Mya arenaria]|uniref:myeloid leukemia factor 1-like n=1 Tax=Mya arenaria TaxID=6604 RepID=UPI0022E3028A|nr:myeloid leukemia factor 1-like [Mya arenaria]
MAGRSMFRRFEEDPFFADHRDQMRGMQGMFQDPFQGMGMLEDAQGRDRRGRERGSSNQLSPLGDFGFGNIFGNMSNMMMNMDKAFEEASQRASSGENGASFQQASFMSYNNTGGGPPKIFQASTATRSGPGGVRESRKAVRDSVRELEKMSIGHHIYDRGHEVEKHRNTRSGQVDELQNYHNLDESKAEEFDREWQEKSRTAFRGLDYGANRRTDRRELKGRQDERDRHRRDGRHERRRDEQLALPAPENDQGRRSEHWGRTAERRDRS